MLRYLVSALVLSASTVHAVELHHVEVRTGTDGLSPVSLALNNAAGEAIACSADIAHWYSVELATAVPGADIRIELWFDPETGTYSVLNDKRENGCGAASKAAHPPPARRSCSSARRCRPNGRSAVPARPIA